MTELQFVDSFPFWKSVIWCFYPMALLVLVELVSRSLTHDDDDDFDGGKMIRSYQMARVR